MTSAVRAGDPILYTVNQAAALCSVSRGSIFAAVRRGELRIVRIGDRATRIEDAELRRWIESRSEGRPERETPAPH